MSQYVDLVFEHQRTHKDGSGVQRGDERVLQAKWKGRSKWVQKRDNQEDTHQVKVVSASN